MGQSPRRLEGTGMTHCSTLCSSRVIPLAGPARKLRAPFSAVVLPHGALSFICGSTGGTGRRCCTNPTTGRFPILGSPPQPYTDKIRQVHQSEKLLSRRWQDAERCKATAIPESAAYLGLESCFRAERPVQRTRLGHRLPAAARGPHALHHSRLGARGASLGASLQMPPTPPRYEVVVTCS